MSGIKKRVTRTKKICPKCGKIRRKKRYGQTADGISVARICHYCRGAMPAEEEYGKSKPIKHYCMECDLEFSDSTILGWHNKLRHCQPVIARPA